jgi:ABC-type lipoprotein export system ATPase subunit
MWPQFSPILERFTLRGLHGYKDITIEFSGAATVIVAENGTGKTTVLSALNAFLTRRFHRLAALPFATLECKFVDRDEPFLVDRQGLGSPTADSNEQLRNLASTSSLTEDELLDFLQGEYSPIAYDRLRGSRVISQLYLNTPYNHADLKRHLDNLHSQFGPSLTDLTKATSSELRDSLGHTDIIYLPTYRRIERPLLRASRKIDPARGYSTFKRPERENSYSYEGIAFGLGDIEARLAELSEEIERASNLGYRNLSARILNDMLKGKSARPPEGHIELPDIRTLSLFLGRVGRVENNLGHLFANIGTLYETDGIYSDEYEFLRYFLNRLNTVILETKGLEQRIEQFVAVCNSYLTMSSDEKQLAFDPKTLKVVVQNAWANCTVPLDALSSGEKQIVSLMAKLYLYEGKKIVLIDEPELSLSIDWQRKVLPDVLNSGSVVQLLAITHSPFVFENELDKYAAGLKVSRTEGVVGVAP